MEQARQLPLKSALNSRATGTVIPAIEDPTSACLSTKKCHLETHRKDTKLEVCHCRPHDVGGACGAVLSSASCTHQVERGDHECFDGVIQNVRLRVPSRSTG